MWRRVALQFVIILALTVPLVPLLLLLQVGLGWPPAALASVAVAVVAGGVKVMSVVLAKRGDPPPSETQGAFRFLEGSIGDSSQDLPSSPRNRPLYRAGDRVRHPSFGVGIVVAVRADARSEIVDVNFVGSSGVKTLDVAFAPLQVEISDADLEGVPRP